MLEILSALTSRTVTPSYIYIYIYLFIYIYRVNPDVGLKVERFCLGAFCYNS